MKAILALLLLTAGCAKSDPPPKDDVPAQGGKPTVRIAVSAAAASAMKPDAAR